MSQDSVTPSPETDEPGLPALVAAVRQDAVTLIKDHVELAKLEMKESGQHAGKGAGLIGALALLALTAWLLISFGLAFVLVSLGLPIWAGMMIVALVYLIIGGIMGLVAKGQFEKVTGPERAQKSAETTIEELKASIDAGANR